MTTLKQKLKKRQLEELEAFFRSSEVTLTETYFDEIYKLNIDESRPVESKCFLAHNPNHIKIKREDVEKNIN